MDKGAVYIDMKSTCDENTQKPVLFTVIDHLSFMAEHLSIVLFKVFTLLPS